MIKNNKEKFIDTLKITSFLTILILAYSLANYITA